MPPTLEDVAKAAKVSTATISRAINTPEKVAPTTLKRIQHTIDDLGYTPNFGGQALAANRTNTVGAVIPTMANAMFATGLQAFQEELAKTNISLLVTSTGYDPKNELAQIRSLVARGADGLLLIGANRLPETKKFLAVRNVPHVISWNYKHASNDLFVGFDNVKAAFEMAKKVLDLGHTQIAIIAGKTNGNDRASDRILGVKKAIQDHGEPARLVTLIEADYLICAGGDAFDAVMAGPQRPTAIICGNDVLAAGAIVRANQRDIRVPDQISITGFDDIGIARISNPALTTVHFPQIRMGTIAAQTLLNLLAHNTPLSSVELPTSVVMRGSLAKPPIANPFNYD